MGIGGSQVMLGRVERAASCWEEAIRRARRPVGATRRAAIGRMFSKRSTARRVTTSKVDGGRVSARTFCISMSVNVRARVTSRRKVAFFWLDSIRVRAISWGPEFYWDSWEACTGAYVCDSGFGYVNVNFFNHRGHGGHGVNLGEEVEGGE